MAGLTTMEKAKLERIRSVAGNMTSEEALSVAIEAEETMKQLGVFDHAWERFYKERDAFLKFAELLEKEEQENKPAA